jgi:hypothetical protein
MKNSIVMWMCAHPLEFVGILCGACALLALTLIPRLHELPHDDHPRC